VTDSIPLTKKINYSPRGTARYCYLTKAREQLDKSKLWAYSCQLVFPAADPRILKLAEELEQAMNDCHGKTQPRAEKGMPLRLDPKDPSIYVLRFKALRFTNDDGSFSPGPKIIDSLKQPWNGQDIGNGSELIVAYKIRPFNNEGVGLTLIPTAVQVIKFAPYVADDGADGFEEQADGYAVQPFAEEFADEFE